MKKKLNEGFTLIELVIIMVILGILAAVAVPRLGSTIDSSQEAAEEAVIGSFRSAVELFAMEQLAEDGNKYYPADPFDALDDKTENTLKQADNNGYNYWAYYMSTITHYRNDGGSRYWSYNSSTGEISSN
jgi:prepilin-type N-terminal cleavage/methylation domain-containing protein